MTFSQGFIQKGRISHLPLAEVLHPLSCSPLAKVCLSAVDFDVIHNNTWYSRKVHDQKTIRVKTIHLVKY